MCRRIHAAAIRKKYKKERVKQMNQPKAIGIIGAMAAETALLIARMTKTETVTVAGADYHCGVLEGVPAVVVQCGIGKVYAAIAAQIMIDRFSVGAIINTGIAGGVKSGLAVGDLVLSTDAVQHDFDLSMFGYAKGYMKVGDKDKPTRYPADRELMSRFRAAAERVLRENRCVEGTIASGDCFIDNNAQKKEIAAFFDAAAVEMEGGAIAQVAFANRVPFIVVRAISALADDDAAVFSEDFEEKAATVSGNIVLEMLRGYAE